MLDKAKAYYEKLSFKEKVGLIGGGAVASILTIGALPTIIAGGAYAFRGQIASYALSKVAGHQLKSIFKKESDKIKNLFNK